MPTGNDHALLYTNEINRSVTYDSSNSSFDMLGIGAPDNTGKFTLNLTGGTLQTTGDQDTIGGNGKGGIIQTGGSYVTAGPNGDGTKGSLILGSESTGIGTYNLSGTGTLSVARFAMVGVNGMGTFSQSAGTSSFGNLYLGNNAGGNGTYNLTGTSSLVVNGWEHVGSYGTGEFNQSGGTHSIGENLSISRHSGSLGTYNLSGGTLNVSTVGITAFKGISNKGILNYSGGQLNVIQGDLTNDGIFNLSGHGTRTVNGNVINNGSIKVTNTTANYTRSFINNGAYISDPSENYFEDLVINTAGYLNGGLGDEFHISGDFLNYSTSSFWNTSASDLFFSSGTHDFFLGETGSSFAWDDLTLDLGTILNLQGGATLHVNTLHVFDLAQFTGLDTSFLTYDHIAYRKPIPEPATIFLLGFGLLGIVGLSRKKR